jgi:hypothetical protein
VSSDDGRVPIGLDLARVMLDVRNGRVHTFRNAGVLVGADWDEADVIGVIIAHGAERSGERATAMHHGLCTHDDLGWVFFRTKDAAE